MIKTMLGAAGTPALAVETVPALREVRVGEVLDGVVEIEGGVAALHIARVTLDLVVRALIHPDPRRQPKAEGEAGEGEHAPEPHHGLIMIAAETIATFPVTAATLGLAWSSSYLHLTRPPIYLDNLVVVVCFR